MRIDYLKYDLDQQTLRLIQLEAEGKFEDALLQEHKINNLEKRIKEHEHKNNNLLKLLE
jgi:hypothetical protein